MAKLFEVLDKMNLTLYKHDRFNLDNFQYEPYQDKGEEFEGSKIFEKDNKTGKFIKIKPVTKTSLFNYFLDGSRLTYKIADMESPDHKFMPVVAGQIAVGVCEREDRKIKKYSLKKEIHVLFHSSFKDDLDDISEKTKDYKINGIHVALNIYENDVENKNTKPENLAIAKINKIMHDMEIATLKEMIIIGILKPDKMLVIDGSLQFLDKNADPRLFENVIGISKTYNPNMTGLLKRKTQHIATILTKLDYGERTPVYEYPIELSNKKIGAWYLRIRPKEHMKNPLDGIVKVEKIAFHEEDLEDGFDSGLIDNISQSILLERNVTSYGKEDRWPNHLYPIYLTEKMLKTSFLSSVNFLNRF